MKKEWKIFTFILLIGFFVFVFYCISPYYNLFGSIGIIIFFVFLAILSLKKAIREEYFSSMNAEQIIKEAFSPFLKKERERDINYLTVVTFFSLILGLLVGFTVQQFIFHPFKTSTSILLGFFVTSSFFLFFVWLRVKKLEKNKKD